VRAILDREAITDHDVAAFVDVVQEAIGGTRGQVDPLRAHVQDVGDTTLCWQMRDAMPTCSSNRARRCSARSSSSPARTATR
jgi:adenylosuccinate lyase